MVVKNVFVGLNRCGELAEVGRLDSALAFFSVFISLVSLRIINLHRAPSYSWH